jgi:hypothetical protein
MAVDMDKLNSFLGRFVGDLGAAVHTGMVVIGEKLGLYKALAAQPLTSSQLAAKTSTDERYVREWLSSQAAGGYISYDEQANSFFLTEEQAFTLANEDSPLTFPALSSSRSALWLPFRALPNHFAPAPVWAGTSMTTVSSTVAKNSFAPVMRPTLSAPGSPHSRT